MSAGRSLFANAKETIELRQGETLFRERDEGTRMFGVIDGSIELLRDGHLVTTIGPGEVFGELALIDNSPRSLQARAATDCVLAAIDRRIGYGAHGQSCDASGATRRGRRHPGCNSAR